MKKLVIFDLDGTLFDTTRSMEACGNHALKKLGLPTFPRERYALFSGGGVEEYVNAILEAAGDLTHENARLFWEYYLEVGEAAGEKNRPYEGIPSLLSALRERVLLAVLSNKDHASCVQIVEEAFGKEVFSGILGDMGTFPPKPDPTGVGILLDRFSLSASDCLYVGDTQVDIRTGKNAGVDTVGALWGYRTREVLEREGATHLISKPEELLNLL